MPIPPQCPVCRQGIERTHEDGADEVAPGLRAIVQTVDNKTFVVIAASTDTVWDLKTKIHEQEGPPPILQRLIFFGTQLEDGRTLADYNIQKESSIYLVLAGAGLERG
jgi:large subunit ribosomal protein L40e